MMLTSTTVLVLTGVALVLYDVASFRQSLARSLVTRADILAANSTAALAFDNRDDAIQVLAALKSDPSTVMAVLYDRQGRLFATYPAEVPASAPPTAPGGRGGWFESSAVVVHQPVIEEGRVLGTLYLKSDLRALTGRLRVFALVVLLAVMGSIGVAFALSTWLQRGAGGAAGGGGIHRSRLRPLHLAPAGYRTAGPNAGRNRPARLGEQGLRGPRQRGER